LGWLGVSDFVRVTIALLCGEMGCVRGGAAGRLPRWGIGIWIT